MNDKFTLAQKALKDKQFHIAESIYLNILKDDPNNALAHQGLACCRYNTNRLEEAVKECHITLEIDPTLPRPSLILALVHWRRKEYQQCEQLLNGIVEKSPDFVDGYVDQGLLLSHLKRFNESIISFKKAIDLDPNNWLAHFWLSMAHMRKSDFKAALQELKQAYSLHRSVITAYGFVNFFVYKNRLWLYPLSFLLILASFIAPPYFTIPVMVLVGFLCFFSFTVHLVEKNIRAGIVFIICYLLLLLGWIRMFQLR